MTLRRWTILSIAFTLAAGVGTAARAGEIHEALERQLAITDATAKVPVYAVFADRIEGTALDALTAGIDNRDERRTRVVSTLRAHATASQADARAMLAEAQADGKVERVRFIWMGNVLAFRGTTDVVRAIAALDAVEEVRYDAPQTEAADAPAPTPGPALGPVGDGTPLQQGLILINAEDAWNLGYEGQGVIFANIDTGVDHTHDDLENNVWINSAEDLNGDGRLTGADVNGIDDDGNGYVDDVLGYDFGDDDHNPADVHGHGTATGGQVCGDGSNGLRTGVAPQAKMMCLKLYDSGFSSSEAGIWEAMQYAVDNGAQITTSSLSWKWAFSPKPNYAMWRTMSDVEAAAGVIHTNSIGNQGGSGSYPIPYNVATPGNSPAPWLHPDQTLRGRTSSTIGCGSVDAFTDIITNSSGRGPSAWEDIMSVHPEYPYEMPFMYRDYPYETQPLMGLLKPDVSSPGASTTSTTIGGGYGGFGGTSAATPHTAGVVALMLSADPSLTPADLARILQLSSIEKGDPGKDIEYGAGRIDALRAVNGALGNLAPTVSSLSASVFPMYAQTTFTITGTNFLADSEVEFDGVPAASTTVINGTTLEVTTPVYPTWDLADLTIRTGLGEVTMTDEVSFEGDLTLNTGTIRVGQGVSFTMRGPANARWGYIINTQTSNCTLKGIDFEVCPLGRLALDKTQMTNVVGSDPVFWILPNDPTLIGETLYIQAGIDGNGALAGKPWRASNVESGLINP